MEVIVTLIYAGNNKGALPMKTMAAHTKKIGGCALGFYRRRTSKGKGALPMKIHVGAHCLKRVRPHHY